MSSSSSTMKNIQSEVRKKLKRRDYINCLEEEKARTVIVDGLQNICGTMSVTRIVEIILCAFEDKGYYIDPHTSYSYSIATK